MAEKGIRANHDGQCQYEHNNERCPLPGNNSNTLGRGGAYWCLYHIRDGNRHHDRAQDEQFRLYSDRQCVADYIENNYTPELKRIWQGHIEDNPEWGRNSGETRADYIARIRKVHADTGLSGKVKRMPGT